MNKIIQKLGLVSLGIMLLIAGCDKDGKNDWLYSESDSAKGAFQPISNITGEVGWGYGIVRWDLPESIKSLTMVDVSWTNAEGVTAYKKLTHFEDSLWLALEGSDYLFRLTSLGAAGESVIDSILLQVPDWKAEPLKNIENFQLSISENIVYMSWEVEAHRAYAKTVFEVYNLDGELLTTVVRNSGESTSAQITILDYNTDYELRYYCQNLAGVLTEIVKYPFKTDRKAPNLPKITVDETSRGTDINNNAIQSVFAYSSDIKWTAPEAGMDSIRVTFTGLKNKTYEFRFKATEQKGWLTCLPGGDATLLVSAKFENEEEWSAAATQVLTTKKPDDMFQFRFPNATVTGTDSKLAQAWTQQISLSPTWTTTSKYAYVDLYSKMETRGFFEIVYKPRYLDEIELCPTLPELRINTAGGVEIDLNEFIKIVDHLPELKVLKVKTSYSKKQQILDTFGNKAKYPNLEVSTY